jgi:hypothetical protein
MELLWALAQNADAVTYRDKLDTARDNFLPHLQAPGDHRLAVCYREYFHRHGDQLVSVIKQQNPRLTQDWV